jgi:hypothetical protein
MARQTRQIYLIGNMDGPTNPKIAVIQWHLGWFTDRIAANQIARDHGYEVIPIKNPTQQ